MSTREIYAVLPPAQRETSDRIQTIQCRDGKPFDNLRAVNTMKKVYLPASIAMGTFGGALTVAGTLSLLGVLGLAFPPGIPLLLLGAGLFFVFGGGVCLAKSEQPGRPIYHVDGMFPYETGWTDDEPPQNNLENQSSQNFDGTNPVHYPPSPKIPKEPGSVVKKSNPDQVNIQMRRKNFNIIYNRKDEHIRNAKTSIEKYDIYMAAIKNADLVIDHPDVTPKMTKECEEKKKVLISEIGRDCHKILSQGAGYANFLREQAKAAE